MMRVEEESPSWLIPLLRANYFVPCSIHADSNKSECNMFCLDCSSSSFCSYCLSNHKNHRVLQVRSSFKFQFVFSSQTHKKKKKKKLSVYPLDTKIIIPQRCKGERDSEVHRHLLCSDIYN